MAIIIKNWIGTVSPLHINFRFVNNQPMVTKLIYYKAFQKTISPFPPVVKN